jgi:hypothetical protein
MRPPPGSVTHMDDRSPSHRSRRTARPAAARRRYYAYVVELDDAVGPRRDPRYPSVYVGQSVVPPAERLHQHKDGYRASRHVRKYGKHLRPRLYRHLNSVAHRGTSVDSTPRSQVASPSQWMRCGGESEEQHLDRLHGGEDSVNKHQAWNGLGVEGDGCRNQ